MDWLFQHTIARKELKIDNKRFVYRCLECESLDRPLTYSLLISIVENGKLGDERFVYDITNDRETVEKIFTILTENAVGPTSFEHVLDAVFDILADE